MMAKTTQVTAFGQNGHGDDRTYAGEGLQMRKVGIGLQSLFSAHFKFSPKRIELLVAPQSAGLLRV